MAIFLVAHGAWSAGFAWHRMRPLLTAMGHALFTPTLTGLGERSHLAGPGIDLSAHIADICATLFYEDLTNVILIGHSYGGMVATGVADRAPERLAQIVYLDAFVPREGQSMFDLMSEKAVAHMRAGAAETGGGWGIPPISTPPDTLPADADWLSLRRHRQPLASFEQKLRLTRGETALPRSYISCTRIAPGDVFAQFAARAKSEAGWRHYEIDASHSPHVTAPEALARLLDRIADGS